jgi:putative oxygen-independent coproporphyrinogen III oxidase
MTIQHSIPLSLYIHAPWCQHKCPYCDFSSAPLNYSQRAIFSHLEKDYLKALLLDLEKDLDKIYSRSLISIFIGGGTPNLFSASFIKNLLRQIQTRVPFSSQIEISMEFNPGILDYLELESYLKTLFEEAGVNRLSIGVQSFQDTQLQAIERIHSSHQALFTIETAYQVGFKNINLDLMYGLPQQTVQLACEDLDTALQCHPHHLSWYQLTLEPETPFGQNPPTHLPSEDEIWDMQQAGEALLKSAGYEHYETSAHALPGYYCQHNLNYWTFGDYLGIGAGAHAKISSSDLSQITRYEKIKDPLEYIRASNFVSSSHLIQPSQRPLEFMLNALRLQQTIPYCLFEERTGLSITTIEAALKRIEEQDFIIRHSDSLQITERGRLFLNNCLEIF